MAFTGPIAKLGQLARNIRKLAEVPSRAAPAVAERIAELVDAQFDAETDPYSNPWQALAASTLDRKRRAGAAGLPILSRSEDMRASVSVTPLPGSGVAITISHPAELHMRGTGKMPARHILPVNVMPAEWTAIIREEVESETAKAVGQ